MHVFVSFYIKLLICIQVTNNIKKKKTNRYSTEQQYESAFDLYKLLVVDVEIEEKLIVSLEV